MHPVATLFAFNGRASRRHYRVAVIPLNVAIFGMLAIVVLSRPGAIPWLVGWALLAAFAAAIVANLALGVRRLHDFGRSGWWTVLYYVVPCALVLVPARAGHALIAVITAPLALILPAIGFLELALRTGDPGANRFGPDPTGGVDLAAFE